MAELNEVNFHLLVELVGHTGRADVRWAWLGPFAAHWTRLDNVGDIVDRNLGDSNLFQEALHGEFGSMPPSDVEFPEHQPDGTLAVLP